MEAGLEAGLVRCNPDLGVMTGVGLLCNLRSVVEMRGGGLEGLLLV